MIPKVIHYIWLGNNRIPKLTKKCIKSWKEHLPDYEIILWNESNLNLDINPYVRQAYDNKKYAFASDVLRLWILYTYGGIYLDTDVEVLKNLDVFLTHQAFCGMERIDKIGPGLIMGAQKGNILIKEMLDSYNNRTFINKDSSLNRTSIGDYLTDVLANHGFVFENKTQNIKDMVIYPTEYFQPIDLNTMKIKLTHNTYLIHHYAATWHTKGEKISNFLTRNIVRFLGNKTLSFLLKIKGKLIRGNNSEKT